MSTVQSTIVPYMTNISSGVAVARRLPNGSRTRNQLGRYVSAAMVAFPRKEPGSNTAVRRNVKLGQSSTTYIVVESGLKGGDVVILSDMSAYDSFERVRLK